MYAVTKDPVILDKLILYCDKVVSIRNTTRVTWSGNIYPAWPSSTNNNGWSTVQGDVAGQLAYCGQLIAVHSSVWNLNVGIGDPNDYGATYRARAEKYLQIVDQTMDLFYNYKFIHADEWMQFPAAPYPANAANDPIPWNQQAMI